MPKITCVPHCVRTTAHVFNAGPLLLLSRQFGRQLVVPPPPAGAGDEGNRNAAQRTGRRISDKFAGEHREHAAH